MHCGNIYIVKESLLSACFGTCSASNIYINLWNYTFQIQNLLSSYLHMFLRTSFSCYMLWSISEMALKAIERQSINADSLTTEESVLSFQVELSTEI